MIVKFDHISYSCILEEEEAVKTSLSGYEEVFAEKDLMNLPIKKEFLKLPAKIHNITMLQNPQSLPIEITAYPECVKGEERLSLTDEGIRILTADIEATTDFYQKLGFKQDGENLRIKPMLDASEICLQLTQVSGTSQITYLDQQGFGILAFVVDNGAKQKRQLESQGIYTTEIQELTVNGKSLKIFFAKSSAGDLVELIGIR